MNLKRMISSFSFSFPLSTFSEKAPAKKIAALAGGIVAAFAMIFFGTLLYSFINFFTDFIKPEYAAPAAMLINILSLFCGGYLTARKSCQQGLIMGLLLACCFYIILLIVGSILGYPISSILSKCYYGLIAAGIGGICGIK